MPPKYWFIDVHTHLIFQNFDVIFSVWQRFYRIVRCISFNHIMHYVPISYIYSPADAMHITKQTWHTRPPGWHDGLLPSPDKRSVSRLVGKWGHDETTEFPVEKNTGQTCKCFSHMIENYWLYGGIHVNSFKRKHRLSDFRWFSPLSSRGLIATVDVTVCSH